MIKWLLPFCVLLFILTTGLPAQSDEPTVTTTEQPQDESQRQATEWSRKVGFKLRAGQRVNGVEGIIIEPVQPDFPESSTPSGAMFVVFSSVYDENMEWLKIWIQDCSTFISCRDIQMLMEQQDLLPKPRGGSDTFLIRLGLAEYQQGPEIAYSVKRQIITMPVRKQYEVAVRVNAEGCAELSSQAEEESSRVYAGLSYGREKMRVLPMQDVEWVLNVREGDEIRIQKAYQPEVSAESPTDLTVQGCMAEQEESAPAGKPLLIPVGDSLGAGKIISTDHACFRVRMQLAEARKADILSAAGFNQPEISIAWMTEEQCRSLLDSAPYFEGEYAGLPSAYDGVRLTFYPQEQWRKDGNLFVRLSLELGGKNRALGSYYRDFVSFPFVSMDETTSDDISEDILIQDRISPQFFIPDYVLKNLVKSAAADPEDMILTVEFSSGSSDRKILISRGSWSYDLKMLKDHRKELMPDSEVFYVRYRWPWILGAMLLFMIAVNFLFRKRS